MSDSDIWEHCITRENMYNREHLGKLLRIVSFDLRISTKSQERQRRANESVTGEPRLPERT